MRSALLAALVTTAFLALAFAPAASAHATQNSSDGKIKITWGWLDEPAFSETKNRLDLIIRDNATNAGIGGLTTANFTELSIHYGEEEYALGNLSAYTGAKGASAGPGNYTTSNPVYLSKPGIYTLHIAGTILGSSFDLEIPASHVVDDVEDITFPAAGDDDAAMEARIAALETSVAQLKAQIKTESETPATLTPATGTAPTASGGSSPIPAPALVLAALGIVGAALLLRRKD